MDDTQKEDKWYEGDDDTEEDSEYSFTEYDITASPNDFNIKTIFDFIQSESFKIPGFQRNYVWDLKRASKLIESIVLGLPIPQIFLYEELKNKFSVIDGQQRLMTIYYFINKRFPKIEKRAELRKIFDEHSKIPDEILHDNSFFEDFNLKLSEPLPNSQNKLNGLNYATLGKERKITFELRTIRNIIIKQNSPPEDNSSMYEIFSRLNTGGVNLKPQEIRTSLYHSDFYNMLYQINLDKKWRNILGRIDPDIHMKDIEILLRGFAMLTQGNNYRPSMTKFLNTFSNIAKKYKKEDIEYLSELFDAFLNAYNDLGIKGIFVKSGRFNISMYEAIFNAVCKEAYDSKNKNIVFATEEKLNQLKEDSQFKEATLSQTSSKKNVDIRLKRACEILLG